MYSTYKVNPKSLHAACSQKDQTHRRSLQFSATAGCTPMVNGEPLVSSNSQIFIKFSGKPLQHWPLPHNKQPIHVLPNQDSPQNPGCANILPQTLSSRSLSSPQLQFLPQILPRDDLQKAFSWTKDSHSCEEEPPGISGSSAEWTSQTITHQVFGNSGAMWW